MRTAVPTRASSRKTWIRRGAMAIAAMVAFSAALPAAANPRDPAKAPVAVGRAGAVATVDANATEAGLAMLRQGGNAVDAAVAAAATLGVTEPYSGGIGGGGFMLIHLARTSQTVVIDGREAAPMDPRFDRDVFVDRTSNFQDAVNSGLSVGTPGTLATWVEALESYGTVSLARALQPAVTVAQRGFVVDETYASQTASNLQRFRQLSSTSELFLVDDEVPAVGSVVRNPDLADTYRLIQRYGPEVFYTGQIAHDIVDAVQDPPMRPDATMTWQPGFLDLEDLATYEVRRPEPTVSYFRGHEIHGMPSPSSGGIAVGQALTLLDQVDDLESLAADDARHLLLEAMGLSFADRNAYVADDHFVTVPQTGLLSGGYAALRWSMVSPDTALPRPIAPGNPCPFEPGPCTPAVGVAVGPTGSTTHLTTADRLGNVVSYTFTIESTGGNAVVVPGRGFLLNNELTDFERTGDGPNLPAPGKRPRSSMSPTIVLDPDGNARFAVGSPGGATIITTVQQIVFDRLARGLSLADALAAPRASQRNTATTGAEPQFRAAFEASLAARGHRFSTSSEIGAATGVELLPSGEMVAVAEPTRRGGGAAGVVRPSR